MTEGMLQRTISQLPIGYATHRFVRDDKNEPVDFVFLESNSTFEEMTGLNLSSIAEKNVIEILDRNSQGDFYWASFYHDILHNKYNNYSVRYAEIHERLYKIDSVLPDTEHFVIIIQDITTPSRNKEVESTSAWDIIFNSTHDAMFLVGYDGSKFSYIRNNRSHQELMGYNPNEFLGKTPGELLGKQIGDIVEINYRQCVETGESITYEETLDLVGGKRVLLTILSPLWKDGKIRYLLGSRADITEVRNLQRDKESLLNRFQAMFKDHAATMLIIEPESGSIVDANPSACTFYGYSHSELTSKNIQSINMLPEEEVNTRRKMACSADQKYFLFPHRLKNGEIRLVDVYSSPIDYDGKRMLFSIIIDVTDREKYRQAMNQERDLLRVTLHSIGDCVLTTDKNGYVTSLNKAAEDVIGWKEHEVLGKSYTEIIRLKAEEAEDVVENPIRYVIETKKIINPSNHTVLTRKDGIPIPINDCAAPILNRDGQFFGVVMVFRDVSHDKEQQEQILYLSYHDSLTGLFNRRFIEDKIKLLDSAQYLPLAVVMGDVNGLKITNDVFGHETGDMLLKNVSQIIKDNCRESDILSRWGGDEFLLLMPSTSLKEAETFIKKIKISFAEKSSGTLQLSVSLGCSVKEHFDEDILKTLREAEESMYHQKLLEGSSFRNTIINTLLATLNEKSFETEEHAERLMGYCNTMGSCLNLSSDELNELQLLAVLHDIGKVGIHQSILLKPGPLTSDEWEEMRRHSEIGYRIAQNSPELSIVSDYILSHHERWDGNGYPRNLKGEQIPLLCRILSVADAFDAMTSDRVYRKALSREAAIAEIRKESGFQFDPYIVEMFLKEMA